MNTASEIRMLRRLGASGVRLVPVSTGRWAAFPRGDRRRRSLVELSADQVRQLSASGVLLADGEDRILGPEGRARLNRLRAGEAGHASQHRELARKEIRTETGRESVVCNLAESPLARFARPDSGTGRAFLTPEEIEAGERLRADLDRSTFNPRLTMDWASPPAGKGAARSGARDPAGAPDAALAARARVHAALDAVAPPLSSVLLDILWRGDGVEALERRENWPRRSGKLAIKMALTRLALHYGLLTSNPARPFL